MNGLHRRRITLNELVRSLPDFRTNTTEADGHFVHSLTDHREVFLRIRWATNMWFITPGEIAHPLEGYNDPGDLLGAHFLSEYQPQSGEALFGEFSLKDDIPVFTVTDFDKATDVLITMAWRNSYCPPRYVSTRPPDLAARFFRRIPSKSVGTRGLDYWVIPKAQVSSQYLNFISQRITLVSEFSRKVWSEYDRLKEEYQNRMRQCIDAQKSTLLSICNLRIDWQDDFMLAKFGALNDPVAFNYDSEGAATWQEAVDALQSTLSQSGILNTTIDFIVPNLP